jgi:uncharacterized protein
MPEQRYLRESAVREVQPGQGVSKCCAYNRTRERFLCADVEAGDFQASSLETHLAAFAPGSGAALWIIPFRNISPTSVRIPLDLVYLDRNCVVLDTVESFPISSGSASSAPAASVLALPANTIASTGTNPGDHLMLCPPEEMKRRLQQLLSAKDEVQAQQADISAAELAARTTGGRVLPWIDRSRPKPSTENPPVEVAPIVAPQLPRPESSPAQEPALAEPAQKKAAAPKSWLKRLLSSHPPDARRAPRESLQGLAAYFFTGGESVAHGVRDISISGFYIFTEERWYPGTVIRMTLTDQRQPTAERSITVNASVVRCGNDGAGLQFVFQDGKNQRHDKSLSVDGLMGGANKAELELFLHRLRSNSH